MALLRLARAAAAQRRLVVSAAQQERDARAAAAQRRLVASAAQQERDARATAAERRLVAAAAQQDARAAAAQRRLVRAAAQQDDWIRRWLKRFWTHHYPRCQAVDRRHDEDHGDPDCKHFVQQHHGAA
jgi:hypothetical protein